MKDNARNSIFWDRVAPPAQQATATLLVLALVAGCFQNTLETFSQSGAIDLLDDALVVAASVCAVLSRPRASPVALAAIALWMLLILGALLRAVLQLEIPFTTGAFLARQIAVPAMLILCGIALGDRGWRTLKLGAIAVALLNAAYIPFEFIFNRPVDPNVTAIRDGLFIYPEGVPGYYLGFWFDGSVVMRAGGFLLNPPTLGILLATGAVLAYHSRGKLLWRAPLVALLLAATVSTSSRAGLLIAAAGMFLPALVALIGRTLTLAAAVAVGVPAGAVLASHGGTGAHLDGLVLGLRDALFVPLGRGFGFAGNYSVSEGRTESSESLLGIAFSAAGLASVLIVIALAGYYIRSLGRESDHLPALGLAAIAAAALAETASGLTGTIPLWIAAGVALATSTNVDPLRSAVALPRDKPSSATSRIS